MMFSKRIWISDIIIIYLFCFWSYCYDCVFFFGMQPMAAGSIICWQVWLCSWCSAPFRLREGICSLFRVLAITRWLFEKDTAESLICSSVWQLGCQGSYHLLEARLCCWCCTPLHVRWYSFRRPRKDDRLSTPSGVNSAANEAQTQGPKVLSQPP